MPPSLPQSALRAPINTIFGTEANVRLLRVLSLAETPLAAGELARRAVLGRTGIYPVLETLEIAGIVEFVGAGAQRQVRYRTSHPLASPIAALFRAEAERVDALVAALRRELELTKPTPIAAWLEGEILSGKDRMGDMISCTIVADPKSVSPLVGQLSERFEKIERKFEVHIEIRGITRSELATRSKADTQALENAILLAGVPPVALLPQDAASRSRRFASHGDHDIAARRIAVAVAAKLKRDPGLASLARRHIARRERNASEREKHELREWSRLLTTMSPSRFQRFLLEPSERATRLRQTLPALELLTPAERRAVLASTTDAEARAAVLPASRSAND